MNLTEDIKQLQRFFAMLYGILERGWIEIRPMKKDFSPAWKERTWIPVWKQEGFARKAIQLRPDHHVFFGVASRKKEALKRRKGGKRSIKALTCLWVDMDEEMEWNIDFELPASCVIQTSRAGYHGYWFLKSPLMVKEITIPKVEAILKALQTATGSDSVSDVSRLLRVLNTFNWKYPDTPKVHIVRLKNLRYRWEEFQNRLDWKKEVTPISGTEVKAKPPKELPQVDLERLPVSKKIKQLIKEGWEGFKDVYQSRSEADQAVVCSLLAHEYDRDLIQSVFENFPIGEKYREKGKYKGRYLTHSIKSAKEFLAHKN